MSKDGLIHCSYAFIQYANMDMAATAKYCMNGKRLGKCWLKCKVGYARIHSTRCLWVGGLTEKSRYEDLVREVELFAKVKTSNEIPMKYEGDTENKGSQIFWRPDGRMEAVVLFDSVTTAAEARLQMRGKSLPNGTSKKLRIDFTDPIMFSASKPTAVLQTISSKTPEPVSTSTPTSPTEAIFKNQNSLLPQFVTLKSHTSTKSVISAAFVGETHLVAETSEIQVESPEKILNNKIIEVSGPKKMLLVNQGQLENIVITTSNNKRKVEKVLALFIHTKPVLI